MRHINSVLLIVFLVLAGCSTYPAAHMSIQELQEKYPNEYVQDIKQGIITHGMTKQMVRDAWGNPDDINRTITSYGVRSQWVYSYGSYGIQAQYVYFEGNTLTTIQDY